VSVEVEGGEVWKRVLERLGDRTESSHLEVGVLEGATDMADGYSEGATIQERAFYHEYGTSRAPERSFIRRGKDDHGAEWADLMRRDLVLNQGRLAEDPDGAVRAAFAAAGEKAADDIKGYINRSLLKPLKPRTIREKLELGFKSFATVPLARTGRMMGAIRWEIKGGPA
jgi:hypothetical protein